MKLRIPLETAKIDPHSETKLRMDFSELCLARSDCKVVYETNNATGLNSAHIIFFMWTFSIVQFFLKRDVSEARSSSVFSQG